MILGRPAEKTIEKIEDYAGGSCGIHRGVLLVADNVPWSDCVVRKGDAIKESMRLIFSLANLRLRLCRRAAVQWSLTKSER